MKSLKILRQFLKRFMSIGDEGAIMAVVLIFVAILLLAGATATILLTTDTQIGSNYKSSQQALYAAEAGAQEARERLRLKPSTDPGYPDIINDDDPDNTEWTYYIGTEEEAQEKGYDSANDAHERTSSLQTDMDYTVVITHQTDPSSGEVLYRGDVDGDGDFDRHTDETRGGSEHLSDHRLWRCRWRLQSGSDGGDAFSAHYRESRNIYRREFLGFERDGIYLRKQQ